VDRKLLLWIESYCCGSKDTAVDRKILQWIDATHHIVQARAVRLVVGLHMQRVERDTSVYV
jgi:hypothetical protein